MTESIHQTAGRTARAVGRQVIVATSALTVVGVIALSAMISVRSRHEEAEHGGVPLGGLHRPDGDWIIDRDEAILLVVVLGAIGVLLTGAIGRLATRRAMEPVTRALRLQRHFVADASHELRAPLTVLSARVQILQRRLARGEPVDDVATSLRADARALTDVLDDLLMSAEGAAWDGCPAAVADVVGEAVDSLRVIARQADVEIDVRLQDRPAAAIAPVSLRRAVVALVDNAIRHSPPKATVSITVAVTAGRTIELRVTDTGPGLCGLAPDDVFDRFTHSPTEGRRRGFGLGLALVRDIAEQCGGSVQVESTSPVGTTFLLRIPPA